MRTGEMNGEIEAPQKSAKQLQKEAKKQAKLDKFKQKQEKKESDNASKVKDKTEVRLLDLFSSSVAKSYIIHMAFFFQLRNS